MKTFNVKLTVDQANYLIDVLNVDFDTYHDEHGDPFTDELRDHSISMQYSVLDEVEKVGFDFLRK